MNSSTKQWLNLGRSLRIVVTEELKSLADPDIGLGEGPAPDLDGIGQGHPGGADRTLDPAQAGSQDEAEAPDPEAARAATGTTTTATRRTIARRRTAPLRTPVKVRIPPSPPPPPLWRLEIPPSLLLLLSFC